MKMRLLFSTSLGLCCLAANAQTLRFHPGRLAVLRAGDGVVTLQSKQSPVFLDEFDPARFTDSPSVTVPIPTNGPDTLFFNGHAATEGNLSRSANRTLLSFAGYGGVNLLQSNGTPSLLDIGRGFCAIDAAGTIHTTIFKSHGFGPEKMNPRGVVSDGTNNSWGCGNAYSTFYYTPSMSGEPTTFKAVANTRALRIINNVLYTSLNGPDGIFSGTPAGIYGFQDEDKKPLPLPISASSSLAIVVPAESPYTKNAAFDIKTDGTVAYMTDLTAGVQKYVKTNGAWKFAYNFVIPQVIPEADNHATGCFGLVVDFTGPAPIIYATTTEGYGGCVNSNRVVRIVDTNASATVTTVAQAKSAQIAFRGIDFTPELQPGKP
jgi:hypothetical protein